MAFDRGRYPGQPCHMADGAQNTGDSQMIMGGRIPGEPDVPAFCLSAPQPSAIPVLIAVPHAGRTYPAPLLDRMRNPGYAAMRLEDRYADLVARGVVQATGAALLVAQAPRAMIDLNRAADDIDWDMFGRAPPEADRSVSEGGSKPVRALSTGRASSGLGVIPRRLPGIGELWKGRQDEAELAERISLIHAPYHACLSEGLQTLRDRWGAALLVDIHSMPPLAPKGGHMPVQFVLGDRFGKACDGSLVASAFSYLTEHRRSASHNRPYAGGYVLERHASPEHGIHALQVEIDRSSYLDARLSEPGEGLGDTIAVLSGLVRRLAGDVAELGRRARRGEIGDEWAEAAE